MSAAITHEDRVADAVLAAFSALPAKAKPRRYPSGTQEWTNLSGIVLSDSTKGMRQRFYCDEAHTDLPSAKDQVILSTDVSPWGRCFATSHALRLMSGADDASGLACDVYQAADCH